MPPKKQQQLQETLETQEQWELFTNKDGLSVVDVYSAWCGPCKAVISLFRRVKNELGDNLLRFAVAKSDSIDALEEYRNRSEPTFLMISAGVLVGVIHGCKGPELERLLKERLQHEHKVLEGEAERMAIIDEALKEEVVIPDDEEEEEEIQETKIEPTKKQVTVLVIKPDIVSEGKVDEIIEKLETEGYEILNREERQLSKEEAAEFYKQHENSEHFEELIEFMSSGPCMTLVLTKGDTGEGIIEGVRQFIGPPDVDQAKQEAPDSLRAQYGTDIKQNAIHASDSTDTSARELAFFFPNYNIPWVPGTEPPIQRTLALIRPSVFQDHKDAILSKIEEAGFTIAMSKELTLTKEEAAEFYKEQEEKEYFDSLCAHMSNGPMMALCLARENAVEKWRELLGPTEVQEAKDEAPESLRAQFSMDGSDVNGLHGAQNELEAENEIQYFFPKEQTVAVIKPNSVDQKEAIVKKIEESGFKVSLSKEQHLTKDVASQLYADHQGSEYFNDLTDFMSSGPSLFMVLTREDAVIGWRALMGSKDPEQAKQENPDSFRALYGENTLRNAVHGSSNKEHVSKTIEMIFGEVEFGPDGSVKEGIEEKPENETES